LEYTQVLTFPHHWVAEREIGSCVPLHGKLESATHIAFRCSEVYIVERIHNSVAFLGNSLVDWLVSWLFGCVVIFWLDWSVFFLLVSFLLALIVS
jgi:hypothetical protein